MKIKRIYIAVLILLSMGMSSVSCSDYLTEKPESFIGPDKVGDSDAAIDTWVTGVYSKWIYDIFCWDSFPRVLDEDCDYVSGPDWAFSSLGAGNFQGDDVSATVWTGCYGLINRANQAIYYINKMTNCTESYKNNALGELYFQKAFAYFLLTRAYGPIPVFDTSVDNGASYNQPRRPISDVYKEITGLLEKAAGLMYTVDNPSFQKGHVCAGSAAGLLAKVYATMASGAMPAGTQMIVKEGQAVTTNGDTKALTLPVAKTFLKNVVAGYENFNSDSCYTKAAKWAKDVMDGKYGNYSLLPYDQLWKKSSHNAPEFMFSIQAVSGDSKYKNGIHTWYSGIYDSNNIITSGSFIGCRYHWYCLFDNDDYRVTDGVRHRWRYYYQVSGNNGFYYPKNAEWTLKATGYDANGNKVTDPVAPFNDGVVYIYNVSSECLAFSTKYDDVTDKTTSYADAYWPFLRYADVVLIYAEAMNELKSADGALSTDALFALNQIRTRSNAPLAVTSGNGAITTKLQLRSTIFEERAKELALEGDRRWDLIRWGIYLDVMNSIGGYDEAGVKKSRQERNLLFPIPSDEISTNKAITSNNPGWN